jgi:hypothetical protein
MMNLYNQLTKTAGPLGGLFSSISGGKNKFYNGLAEHSPKAAKNLTKATRAAVIIVPTIPIATGIGGYAIGRHQNKQADASKGLFSVLKSKRKAGKDAAKAYWETNASPIQKKILTTAKVSTLLGTGAAGGYGIKKYLDKRKSEQQYPE